MPAVPSPAVAEYLDLLDRSLWAIGPGHRRDLLTAVGEHLEEACAAEDDLPATRLETLIQAFGPPRQLAGEFRRAYWADRGLEATGLVLPAAAAALWMAVMGLLMGTTPDAPGYLGFLLDFPAVLLVVASARLAWREAPSLRRHLLSGLVGLIAALTYCHLHCGGSGFAVLEHSLYGAYLGLMTEGCRGAFRFGRVLRDGALFILLMQVCFVGRIGHLEILSPGQVAYHLLNGLGIQFLVWLLAALFRNFRRSEVRLAPRTL